MPAARPTIDVNAVLLQEKRQKRARRLNQFCWFYVVLLLIYWTVLIWYGDTWWPGTLLLYGPRWPMAVPLALLAPLAWEWSRKALIPCIIALLILAFPIGGLTIPISALTTSVPADTGKVRIVSFNANMGKFKMAPFNAFLKQTKPDLVVCQEWPVGFEKPEEWQQGWHFQEHPNSILIASRFPIAKHDLLLEKDLQMQGGAGWYDLNTPFGPVSLAAVHLPTPRGEGELEEILQGKWHKLADLDLLSERRLYASRYVKDWLSKFPGPMIVVGDFNLPGDSSIYASVWNRYQDAFGQAGWGWGYTKWTRWYGIRIDHILFEKGWAATKCWVGKDVGSDHLPLVADIVFTGGN